MFRKSNFAHCITMGWLLISLFQAANTELFDDEAYYWMYAQFLDWGYLDHPPMIALMIKIGYFFFHNEFGVRLLTTIAGTWSIWILWKMTDEKNLLLFWGILASIFIFQLSGLLAVPDSPLFLTVALFFYILKRYLEYESWKNIFLLGIIIAAMAYSKYHSGLILFFTLLALPFLLKRKSFWQILGIAFLLYLPHIYWLIKHDFVPFHFHLGIRLGNVYTIQQTFDAILGIFGILGPFTGIILIAIPFIFKPKNDWQKSLKYCFIGVFSLLILLSFQLHIEANWIVAACIPMVLIAYTYLSEHAILQKWFWRLAIPSYCLLFICRVYLVWDFLPAQYHIVTEFHGWKQWANQWKALANGRPIIFENSYQDAAKYIFYAHESAFDANNVGYHRTQFDYWNLEKDFQGKKAIFVGFPPGKRFQSANGMQQLYAELDDFTSFGKVKIKASINQHYPCDTDIEIPITLQNGYGYPIDFKSNPYCMPYLKSFFYLNNIRISEQKSNEVMDFVLTNERAWKAKIHTPKEKGKYHLIFCLSQCIDYSINGDFLDIVVE